MRYHTGPKLLMAVADLKRSRSSTESRTLSRLSRSETPPGWTKAEAAAQGGVTVRSIERLAARGLIQTVRWRRPTGGPILVMYHPDDVMRETAKLRGPVTPFVVPAGAGLVPSSTPTTESLTVQPSSESSTVSRLSRTTLFVTVPEAAAILGLTQAYVRRAIASGTLPAVKDRGWRIRRKDLEAL